MELMEEVKAILAREFMQTYPVDVGDALDALLALIKRREIEARIDENRKYHYFGDFSPYMKAGKRILELEAQLKGSNNG